MKRIIYTILFPLAAYIILLTQSDYLQAVEENDLFVGSHTFMAETLKTQGGIWSWLGSYLTQFFYYPWLGSLLLIAIWITTYILIVDAFKLKNHYRLLAWIPICALLISVTDIGYWIYYIKMPGYWFSQSVSFFAVILLTWILGQFIGLFLKKNISWLLFIIAYFAVCQKFPEFQRNNYSNHTLQIPFIVAPISVVLLPLLKLIRIPFNYKWKTEIMTAITLIAFSTTAYLFSFRNYNFNSELRMMSAIESCEWEKVIDEAKAAKHPTNLMIIYKNIALMHMDRLTDMFKIDNCGGQPETGDSLKVNIAQIGASMIYYQFGQINYAYRWAMENYVEHGLKVRDLKMLARCAIMNHEFDVAAKYLAILNATTFHKSWAKEREPMLRFADSLIGSKEYKNISPLIADDINMLGMDSSIPEKWLLDHFSDLTKANNQKLEDVIMCTSLWTEDEYSFCIHFYNYWKNHQGEPMPELYQQGALLFGKSESSPINVDKYPFDQILLSRYENFKNEYTILADQGMNDKDIGDKLKKSYGDTYWWYYYFYTDFKLY